MGDDSSSIASLEKFSLASRLADVERQLGESRALVNKLAATPGYDSRLRYELLFSYSRDIILFIRPDDGCILDANPAALTTYGYTRDEFNRLRVTDLWDPAEVHLVRDQLSRAIRGGITFETHHLRKDGSTFPVEISSQGAQIGDEKVIISIIRDVSERKRQEAELGDNERQYNALFNARTNAIAHCRMIYNADGRAIDYIILRVNPTYELITGIPKDRIEGRRVTEAFPGIEKDPFDYIGTYGKIAREGGELFFETYFHWHHKWVSAFVFSPIPDEFSIIFYDITDRKQTEDALRESEERFRVAVKNAPAFYAQADRDLRYVWTYNHLPGFPLEKILGSRDDELIDSDEARFFMALKQKVLDSGVGIREELSLFPGGAVYDVTIEPLRRQTGEVMGVSIAALDITKMKRAQEELSDYAEKLKISNHDLEQFSMVVSHDLQEPLRKIIRFGDSVKDRLKPGMDEDEVSDADAYLERMKKAAWRLQGMIEGLLELSRISTRGSHFETTHMTEIAEEVLSDLETSIHQTGVMIDLGALPTIEADPLQMRQLLQNLVSNAVKFHALEEEPVIRIRGEILENGKAAITIEDNGIGFDERDIAWIFQPFRRLHTAEEYKGIGLGLAICQRIVERHHGRITVTSRPGKGSRFGIELPVRQSG